MPFLYFKIYSAEQYYENHHVLSGFGKYYDRLIASWHNLSVIVRSEIRVGCFKLGLIAILVSGLSVALYTGQKYIIAFIQSINNIILTIYLIIGACVSYLLGRILGKLLYKRGYDKGYEFGYSMGRFMRHLQHLISVLHDNLHGDIIQDNYKSNSNSADSKQ